MKITALGICPPPSAGENPAVTPELLASTFARYSRSNRGIDTILQSIDWNNPDASVDAIFRFVDYGHASIAGMTGGIPVIIDGCSMFLAYKLFEIAQLCDGQESSTRYIKLDSSNLPDAQEIGIPGSLAGEWRSIMDFSFECYNELYSALDDAARENPDIIRYPAGANEKVIARLRKNYALDRARYFIPFATKTNAAFIMTARVWADTLKQLASLPLSEAQQAAEAIRNELSKFVPRLMRHSHPDAASLTQARLSIDSVLKSISAGGLPVHRCNDETFVAVDNSRPDFLPDTAPFSDAFAGKENRYSITGSTIRRSMVRVAWNNIALAELRDLNRHRSGYRFSPLAPAGFYLPEGISHPKTGELLERNRAFVNKLLQTDAAPAYVYALHLGTQVPFEHSTHLDKFIYEIELRTGMGAHFRYAEHLNAVHRQLCEKLPGIEPYITVGDAEPE